MFPVYQSINVMVLMTLLKIFPCKLVTKTQEIRSPENKRQLVAKRNQKYLDLSMHRANLEEKISTQIVILKTNTVHSQWQDNFNFNFNSNFHSNQDLPESSPNIVNNLTDKITLKSKNCLLNLAQVNFEEKIIETFIDRLYHPSLLQTELINTKPINYSKHIITILSSFILSENQRENLVTAIREKIAVDAKIEFEARAELSDGIELHDRGYKISWNLKHYLIELKEFRE